jgi:hypothetical protein
LQRAGNALRFAGIGIERRVQKKNADHREHKRAGDEAETA